MVLVSTRLFKSHKTVCIYCYINDEKTNYWTF